MPNMPDMLSCAPSWGSLMLPGESLENLQASESDGSVGDIAQWRKRLAGKHSILSSIPSTPLPSKSLLMLLNLVSLGILFYKYNNKAI